MDKILRGIKNPNLVFRYLLGIKLFRLLPNSLFIKIEYYLTMNKKLEIKSPKTFNEKLQWLKLYDRKTENTQLVDKYKVREYISNNIGEQYLIPALGVYSNFEEIDFDRLPNKFVLKPNHTSGNVYICKDKSKINFDLLRKEINYWLERKYYWVHREWPYKNIEPKIICEKYMVDETENELKDYKFYCFNGEPKLIQVMSNRKKKHYYINHFDTRWNKIEVLRKMHQESPLKIKRPKYLEDMLDISRELSKNIPFVRIDLYQTNEGVYFGEFTFFPVSGFIDFKNEKDDDLLGTWLKLPDK